MSLSGIILVLISASLHIGWNFLTKSSSKPRVFSLIKGTAILAISIIFLSGIPIHVISNTVWFYAILSGVVHALYIFALSTAYEKGDISYVYPIARSAPAFVPMAAFIAYGEKISLHGGLGILVVVVCIFLLQLRGEIGDESKRILTFIKKKDSIWAFITLGSVVTYSIIDRSGMVAFSQVKELQSNMHGPIYFMLEASFANIFFWVYMLTNREFADAFIWKREWFRAIVAGVGTLLSYSLILHVMKTEYLSYIVTLRQSSVLIAVLIGWIILKERHGPVRLVAAVALLAGMFLVATSN